MLLNNPLGNELKSFCNLLETLFSVWSTTRCNFVPRLDLFSSSTDCIDRQAEKPENALERLHLHAFSDPFSQFNTNPDGLHPKSFKPNCGITPPKTTTDSKAIKTSKQLCFLAKVAIFQNHEKWCWKQGVCRACCGKQEKLKRSLCLKIKSVGWGLSSSRWEALRVKIRWKNLRRATRLLCKTRSILDCILCEDRQRREEFEKQLLKMHQINKKFPRLYVRSSNTEPRTHWLSNLRVTRGLTLFGDLIPEAESWMLLHAHVNFNLLIFRIKNENKNKKLISLWFNLDP